MADSLTLLPLGPTGPTGPGSPFRPWEQKCTIYCGLFLFSENNGLKHVLKNSATCVIVCG